MTSMIDWLLPLGLFLAVVATALSLPCWRRPAGPVAELVALAALLEVHAYMTTPGNPETLPSGCILVTFVAYVLLRVQKVLATRLDAAQRQAPPPATAPATRFNPEWLARSFRPGAVASSLHLLPFAAVTLLPAVLAGVYVPATANIGTGLLFGLLALVARRFGVVILVLCSCAAFVGCWQAAEDATSRLFAAFGLD